MKAEQTNYQEEIQKTLRHIANKDPGSSMSEIDPRRTGYYSVICTIPEYSKNWKLEYPW